jgi:hypothetical protein
MPTSLRRDSSRTLGQTRACMIERWPRQYIPALADMLRRTGCPSSNSSCTPGDRKAYPRAPRDNRPTHHSLPYNSRRIQRHCTQRSREPRRHRLAIAEYSFRSPNCIACTTRSRPPCSTHCQYNVRFRIGCLRYKACRSCSAACTLSRYKRDHCYRCYRRNRPAHRRRTTRKFRQTSKRPRKRCTCCLRSTAE